LILDTTHNFAYSCPIDSEQHRRAAVQISDQFLNNLLKMNLNAELLIQNRQEEVKKLGGEAAYRLHALKNLKLKTVIKESHSSPIHALTFNHTSPSYYNLLATVGGDNATVYNDEHMGDYLSVVVHFQNVKTNYANGGQLSSVCWLDASTWTNHPHGDAYLAVSGADTNISLISIVEARVTHLLKGHKNAVVDLSAVPFSSTTSSLLVSLSKDGEIRLWDGPKESCLSCIQHNDASCIAVSQSGDALYVGTTRGRLFSYAIIAPSSSVGTHTLSQDSKQELKSTPSSNSIGAVHHTEAIDCIRCLPGGRIATKSTDGRMFTSTSSIEEKNTTLSLVSTWKVPGCSTYGGLNNRCLFSSTPDGAYVCVGNGQGDCYVYSADSGERCAHVLPIKVTGPVKACGLSSDCRHLVAVLGNGFMFRYEYLPAAVVDDDEEGEEEEGEEENTNVISHGDGDQEMADGGAGGGDDDAA
jgi:WD40 repeat protein